jgi:hypothetical protein
MLPFTTILQIYDTNKETFTKKQKQTILNKKSISFLQAVFLNKQSNSRYIASVLRLF